MRDRDARLRDRRLFAIAGGLALLGIGLFAYKLLVRGFPLFPGTAEDLWEIEVAVSFLADGDPVEVRLYLPGDEPGSTVEREDFVSGDYNVSTRRSAGNRAAEWASEQASGDQALFYRCLVRRKAAAASPPARPASPAWPDLPDFRLAAAEAILAEALAQSRDLDGLVADLFALLDRSATNTNVSILLEDSPSRRAKTQAAVALLALHGVPARVVRGVRLERPRRNVPLVTLLEAWDGDAWRAFDPSNGKPAPTDDFVVWWRGSGSLARLVGGSQLQTTVAIRPAEQTRTELALARASGAERWFNELSLQALPVATQEVYRVLLLVPVGALIVVLMRTVVGFRTLGTFMPVLIGLAFRETRLLWGLALFTFLVAVGFTARRFLERLRLLLVPRLATVLTLVVLAMAAISVVSNRLGLERGVSVGLFPMVILTMTIEHMSTAWEERGPREAILQGLGSLATATLVYLVINARFISHLVFTFPELLLVLLAGVLLLGRYSGYRLTELRRFAWLQERA